MIKYITSRKNQIVLQTIAYRDNKISSKDKKFVIEGNHLFEMAKLSNNISYILTTKHINDVDENIDQYIVTKDILDKVSQNQSSPDVICVCNYVNDKIELKDNLLYLDGVQDPGNLGTILRSALAFSYFNILVSNDSVNKYNGKAVQASQGALFQLNIENSNIERLKELKEKGYKIIVSILSKDATKLKDFQIKNVNKYVLVLGNEGQGIKKEIIDLADFKVFIEMSNIDSLNVGTAGSILMYEFSKNK